MKKVVGVLVAVATLFASLYVRAEQSDMTVEFTCADTWIVGAPNIITVTIVSKNPVQSPFPGPKIDLASDIKQGVALALKLDSASQAGIQVGYPGYGRPEVEIGPLAPGIGLNIEEPVTFTFDVNQLLFGGDLREWKNLPVGKFRVTVMFYAGAWRSAPKDVTIRQPTADEKRFLDAIQKQGIRKKWFPAVILNDKMEVPDDIPLPAETALLRDFIKVLRVAVRNPDVALKEIEDRKETWGYMQDIVAELKYECITKSQGKNSAVAQTLRRTLDADPKMKGRLTRIEKGGGILDHFAEMKAAKPKEK